MPNGVAISNQLDRLEVHKWLQLAVDDATRSVLQATRTGSVAFDVLGCSWSSKFANCMVVVMDLTVAGTTCGYFHGAKKVGRSTGATMERFVKPRQ